MARQRTDDMRSVAVIAVTWCIVAVDAGVEQTDFAMIGAEDANGRVGGPLLGMLSGRGGRVSKAGMVGINAAVRHTHHHACTVEPDVPKRMSGQRAVLDEGRGLTVACVGLEDRLSPQQTGDAKCLFWKRW